MVQDQIDNSFTIIVQNNKDCQMKPDLCYRIVRLFYQDKHYILKRSGLKQNTNKTYIFNYKSNIPEFGIPILTTPKKILPVPGHYPGLRAERLGHFLLISLDAVNTLIKWDGQVNACCIAQFINLTSIYCIQYLVQIEVKENLWNRTSGLCGTIDGNPKNDMQVKDGSTPRSVVVLATNWQVDTIDGKCSHISRQINFYFDHVIPSRHILFEGSSEVLIFLHNV